jgi:hypothetical protein
MPRLRAPLPTGADAAAAAAAPTAAESPLSIGRSKPPVRGGGARAAPFDDDDVRADVGFDRDAAPLGDAVDCADDAFAFLKEKLLPLPSLLLAPEDFGLKRLALPPPLIALPLPLPGVAASSFARSAGEAYRILRKRVHEHGGA